MRPRIRIKQSVNNSIILAIPAALFGLISSVRESSLMLAVISLIGAAGVYLTFRKKKSAAFVFLAGSIIAVVMRYTGHLSIAYPVLGLCCSFASMNNFQLLNLGSPAIDVRVGGVVPEIPDDIMDKQKIWIKQVNEFTSKYTIFAYYGYTFLVIACMALSGVWLFAPEIIKGYSREFWALGCSAGLVIVSALLNEIMKRNM